MQTMLTTKYNTRTDGKLFNVGWSARTARAHLLTLCHGVGDDGEEALRQLRATGRCEVRVFGRTIAFERAVAPPQYTAQQAKRALHRLWDTVERGSAEMEAADAMFDGGEFSGPYHAREQANLYNACTTRVTDRFGLPFTAIDDAEYDSFCKYHEACADKGIPHRY